ncbi:hypothetical protein MWN33_17595 [Starkeya koreensis]|uniref:Uncharacterized protein n=1 Tax=Ancylobacter koreensis TaxID=266121 RepID=A0ABT0DRE7_9HYPH|nr:hypothetical protein [Ancylobacter koreensis]MCK0209849.1 hypothetical protein [Ancylobacter koreensis]
MRTPALLAWLAAAALVLHAGQPARAQDAAPGASELTLNFSTDPDSAHQRVSIWRKGARISLADGSNAAQAGAKTPLHIALEPPLPEPLWLVTDWKDGGGYSAYPILLVQSVAGLKADVLFVKDASARPSSRDIRQRCERETVKGDEHAFRMYFFCKAAAVADPSDEGILRRAALQGWLKANQELLRVVQPVSPFTYDPDLAEALREIVGKVDREGDPDSWKPLRIDDARQFVTAFDARSISLYRLVSPLKDSGDIKGALAMLDYVSAAYDKLVGPDGTRTVDGVNGKRLTDDRAFLETLLRERAARRP